MKLLKVTFPDVSSSYLILRPEERDCIKDYCEDGETPVVEEIDMTEEEFEALPEFEGF